MVCAMITLQYITDLFAGAGHFAVTVPLVCLICFAGLVIKVFDTGTSLWRIDMEEKQKD